jgi:hypothetical protein
MRIKRSQERMILAGRVLLQQQQQKVDAPEVAAHFDRVRGDLQSRGVAEDLSCKIAAQLCDQHDLDALSPSQYEAMLEGATLACGAHCEADEDSQATTGRVRDIERMMQAFAGELAKLDESLEILATYVQRMRKLPATKLSTRKNETLH